MALKASRRDCYWNSEELYTYTKSSIATILPAKNDSDFMFCLQS